MYQHAVFYMSNDANWRVKKNMIIASDANYKQTNDTQVLLYVRTLCYQKATRFLFMRKWEFRSSDAASIWVFVWNRQCRSRYLFKQRSFYRCSAFYTVEQLPRKGFYARRQCLFDGMTEKSHLLRSFSVRKICNFEIVCTSITSDDERTKDEKNENKSPTTKIKKFAFVYRTHVK